MATALDTTADAATPALVATSDQKETFWSRMGDVFGSPDFWLSLSKGFASNPYDPRTGTGGLLAGFAAGATDAVGHYQQQQQDDKFKQWLNVNGKYYGIDPKLAAMVPASQLAPLIINKSLSAQQAKPTDLESNLRSMGLKPGTPEYNRMAYQMLVGGQLNTARHEQVMEELERRRLGVESGFGFGGGAPGAPGGGTGGDSHGDDYLKTLDPKMATLIKGYAEGRLQIPGGFAMRSPFWQNMLQAITQYDPSFDASNYTARSSLRKSMTSGPDAANATSLNMTAGHMARLSKSLNALDDTGVPLLNAPTNLFEKFISGDPRQTRVEEDLGAVAQEMTKAFRGTGGAEADVKSWAASIPKNGTKAQRQAWVNEGVNLIQSRVSAVNDKWTRGMGSMTPPLQLLSPEAQKIYDELGGDPDTGGDGANNTAPRYVPSQQGAGPVTRLRYNPATGHVE